ncbi:hypothetical protein F4779DRAFT_597323 [Xylariaceae sp. FL0662B]|nr:hypothetical protein F4779DRAFT_597323 [Xylariaceae sp. FL0662B]
MPAPKLRSFTDLLYRPGLCKETLRQIHGDLTNNLRRDGLWGRLNERTDAGLRVEELCRTMVKFQHLAEEDKDGFYHAVERQVRWFIPDARGEFLALIAVMVKSRRTYNETMSSQTDETASAQPAIVKINTGKKVSKEYSMVTAVQQLLDFVDGVATQSIEDGPEVKTSALARLLGEDARVRVTIKASRQKKPDGWVDFKDIIPITPSPIRRKAGPMSMVAVRANGKLAEKMEHPGVRFIRGKLKELDFDPETTSLTRCLDKVAIGRVVKNTAPEPKVVPAGWTPMFFADRARKQQKFNNFEARRIAAIEKKHQAEDQRLEDREAQRRAQSRAERGFSYESDSDNES